MKKTIMFFIVLFFAATSFAATPAYHVLKHIEIGGQGGWDYLSIDQSTRRLFVSHDTYVAVVDLNTDQVVADIPDTPGVHGIALAPEIGRGFISCGRADKVLIFDLSSLKILGEVKTGGNPDGILYDPASKRVFASNARSGDMTVFDAFSGETLGTIALGGKGESPHTDGNGKLYVNIEDSSEVVEIDIETLAVTNRFPIAPGEEPTGMAVDPAHHRIFSGCGNQIMTVLDTETGKVTAQVPIGIMCDGVGFDAETGLIFTSNGEGTLTVIKETAPGKFEVAETVPTRRGARTLTVDSVTQMIYLPVGPFNRPPRGGPGVEGPDAQPHGGPGGRGSGDAPPSPPPATDEGGFEVMVVGK